MGVSDRTPEEIARTILSSYRSRRIPYLEIEISRAVRRAHEDGWKEAIEAVENRLHVAIDVDMPKARHIAEQIAEELGDLPVWDAIEQTAEVVVRCAAEVAARALKREGGEG